MRQIAKVCFWFEYVRITVVCVVDSYSSHFKNRHRCQQCMNAEVVDILCNSYLLEELNSVLHVYSSVYTLLKLLLNCSVAVHYYE